MFTGWNLGSPAVETIPTTTTSSSLYAEQPRHRRERLHVPDLLERQPHDSRARRQPACRTASTSSTHWPRHPEDGAAARPQDVELLRERGRPPPTTPSPYAASVYLQNGTSIRAMVHYMLRSREFQILATGTRVTPGQSSTWCGDQGGRLVWVLDRRGATSLIPMGQGSSSRLTSTAGSWARAGSRPARCCRG